MSRCLPVDIDDLLRGHAVESARVVCEFEGDDPRAIAQVQSILPDRGQR